MNDAAALPHLKFGVGQPVHRKEDPHLVRGRGRYADDVALPGQAFARVVRSHHAHGRIRRIDARRALALPGVLAVYTGADLAAAGYGAMVCKLPLRNADGSPLFQIGLVAVLAEAGMTVADEAADVERAIAAIKLAAPAVAVVDLDLPDPGGIAVLEALQNAAVPTRVLILAAGSDSAPLYRALSLGVGGYLAKRCEADRVCAAIACDSATPGRVSNEIVTDGSWP